MSDTSPLDEYRSRRDARRKTFELHEARHRFVGTLRLAAGIALGAVLIGSLGLGRVSPWWIFAPILAFVVLIAAHSRIAVAKRRAGRAILFYENGIARIEDRWAGTGSSELMRDDSHLYAADLDLFGKASLFELLSTARTRAGEETLADWLAAPAGKPEILSRQRAIEDLRDRLDLREYLAVAGAEVRPGIHPRAMTEWGTDAPVFRSGFPRIAAAGLTLVVVSLLAAWFATGRETWITAYYYALGAAAVFALIFRSPVNRILEAAESPRKYLELLSTLLARLEDERFSSERLVGLQKSLETAHETPSRQVLRLSRLMEALTWNGIDIFVVFGVLFSAGILAPFTLILLWKSQIAFAVDRWRCRSGPGIDRWLAVVGEFEALCALAGYAYEHPADPFPDIVEDGPLFDGEEMRHPLLPDAKFVPNSLRMDRQSPLVVVSGSNMSGKSTMLRNVGINTVLALAGAPVRARRLSLSPVALGSTIRIQDSLQAGTSRFYAEIQRIRRIVDLTEGRLPVLFLLDEVLHGTNSHDRALGAEAIVRGLIAKGAFGLATTHDLALTHVADSLGPLARNVHFEDHLEDGQMRFDYRMRPGVVERSNALELMRAVGLDV